MSFPKAKARLRCEHCDKFFEVAPNQSNRRRFCSVSCKNSSQDQRKRKSCITCGIEFSRSPSRDVGAKYCSFSCYVKSTPKRPDCSNCGEPLSERRLTYCSWECFKNGRRDKTEHPCQSCGKVMLLQPAQVGRKKYCSRPCLAESKRIQGAGWKYTRKDGYVHVYYPKHPDSTKAGWVLEHRLVAEEKYGRRVLKTEHVHHINGVKSDNRPENLEIVDASLHAGISNRQGAQKRKSMKEELEFYRKTYGPLQATGI